MPDLTQRLGEALSDRYRIEREIGRGGMATVFLAEDLKHHRRVAIKVLDPEVAAAIGRERFLREVETIAALTHPHILPLHDSGAAGDFLFYVMPYAEGESLRDRLTREKQLPLEDALRLTREVASALSYAHGQGIVHRDIKPENILLVSGHAVLADFGIARAVATAGHERLTATGLAVGTPSYTSPEQAAASRDLDGRSDIYSLGCVLYEMLAGVPPFTGPTAESLAHQHLNVAPRAVTELRPTVPGWVATAVRRALAKSPADRFTSVARFAEALASGDHPPGGAPAAPQTSPARAWWWFSTVGIAALVVIVGAILLLRSGRRAPGTTIPPHARTEVAVLPFQNLSADASNAYFAGGLQDELLTQLTKVAALKVISRTSVMSYQGTSKPLKQIAAELGVGSIVEGSVQVVGRRLRVTVQLIDAATDEHLWADQYDRTLDDAFAIQSEIAQKVVNAVGAVLSDAEQERLAAVPTANDEAYRLYLQGNEYWNRLGFIRGNWEAAQQLYERALAIDPNFALAHAALSLVHGHMYWFGYDPTPARTERQRAEAEAALRLAPDLPQAHLAMGVAHFFGQRDYDAALRELAIALKGLPNDADVLKWIAYVHRRSGHLEEAYAAYDRIKVLNPRDPDTYYDLGGRTYRLGHRYRDAVAAFDSALRLAPDLNIARVDRGWVYIQWQGQLDSLRAELSRIPAKADLGPRGGLPEARAEFLLVARSADSLLQMPKVARGEWFEARDLLSPGALYAAWAHQLRGERAAAQAAFVSALAQTDSTLRDHGDEWPVHVARGFALAGLGRRADALRETRWLEESTIYRTDAIDGPDVAAARAQILAQAGEADAALDEIERLLSKPSELSVPLLRLDPRWDALRELPRFKTLLAKYGGAAPN